MKIFSTPDLRAIEQYTMEQDSVTSLELMERAATAIVYEIVSQWRRNKHICIFAGPGNNGGDALAVARLLMVEGYFPEVYLFRTSRLSDECSANRDRLIEEFPQAQLNEIVKEFRPPHLTADTLVVDGLFGAGMNKPMTGGFTSLVEYINDSEAFVASIDVPSGLACDWEQKNEARHIIRAHVTYAIQYPKLAFFLRENAEYVGEWKVIDIGLQYDEHLGLASRLHYIEENDVKQLLRERSRFTDKTDYGHGLLVGGRYGMVGATLLAAKAALHSGIGMLTVHAPRCANIMLQTAVPEALYDADEDDLECYEARIKQRYNALGVGIGMGRTAKPSACLRNILSNLELPAVFDADALNIMAANKSLLDLLPADTIITPHVREFERLFDCVIDSDAHRLQQAIAVAHFYQIVIVLKGAYTAIITPKGDIYFNTTGNSGMATAGSGDVLTGIITSLLAQGYPSVDAAIVGVYLHGLAGDLAVAEGSEESLVASDIVSCIGKAYKKLRAVSFTGIQL